GCVHDTIGFIKSVERMRGPGLALAPTAMTGMNDQWCSDQTISDLPARASAFHVQLHRGVVGGAGSGHEPRRAGPMRSMTESIARSTLHWTIPRISARLADLGGGVVLQDPGSQDFRDALDKAIALIDRNLALPNTITVTRNSGKCADPRPAFAWTTIGKTL